MRDQIQNDDHLDTKRRVICIHTIIIFIHSLTVHIDCTQKFNSTPKNDNRPVLWPVTLNSAASNASFSSSYSRTSPSVTASESHLSQSQTTETTNNRRPSFDKSAHSNIAKQLNGITKTLGLNIPNISINPVGANNTANGCMTTTNTERMNRFLFGQQQPANISQPQFSPMSTLKNVGASLFGNNFSPNNIDKELQKEVNKREMRQIISSQLDQIKQQMLRQEKEDEARVQALKFMKMIQTQSQQIQKNPLPINPALRPTATASLPLPQFLQIPSVNMMKPIKPSLSASSMFGYAQNIKKQQLRMPKMSDGNEWKAVSDSDGHIECNKEYKGYGRDTLIAASKQIQSRSKMSQSQIEIVCNCMIELSFTEDLNGKPQSNDNEEMDEQKLKKFKMTIDSGKISSLNMNLNANSKKINGFSPLFRSQSNANYTNQTQPAFRFALPTFKQTSNSLMPRLEIDSCQQNDNHLASSISESSDSASSECSSSDESENEVIQKPPHHLREDENEQIES